MSRQPKATPRSQESAQDLTELCERLMDMVRKYKAREGQIVRGLWVVKAHAAAGNWKEAETAMTYLMATDLKDALEAAANQESLMLKAVGALKEIAANGEENGLRGAAETADKVLREIELMAKALAVMEAATS